MYDYDGPLPELFTVATVKARKAHSCCECQRPISVGEKYVKVAGKWDGHFDTFKVCVRCDRLRTKIEKRSEYVVCFGELREAVSEEWANR